MTVRLGNTDGLGLSRGFIRTVLLGRSHNIVQLKMTFYVSSYVLFRYCLNII